MTVAAGGNTVIAESASVAARAIFDSYDAIFAPGPLRLGFADIQGVITSEGLDALGYGSINFADYSWRLDTRSFNQPLYTSRGSLFPVLLGAPIFVHLHGEIFGSSDPFRLNFVEFASTKVNLNYKLFERDGVTDAAIIHLEVPEPSLSAIGGLLAVAMFSAVSYRRKRDRVLSVSKARRMLV